MTKTLTIDGNAIHDIPSFHDEINRVFMSGEDWALGKSLDALSDMFHGGYGAISGREPVILQWMAMEKNRNDLGLEATRAFYRGKLARPETFDTKTIGKRLAAVEAGEGPTCFDIVLDIIAEHPNIELQAL